MTVSRRQPRSPRTATIEKLVLTASWRYCRLPTCTEFCFHIFVCNRQTIFRSEVGNIANLRNVSAIYPELSTMKNTLLILLFFTFYHVAFGQNRILTDEEINDSGPKKMTFIEKCEDVENLFKADLKKQTLFLLLQGGIAPVVITTDKAFENKYQVYYYDFGCIAPNSECVKMYNKLVFNHLTKMYGNKWKKEVRKDVIGLKK